MNHLRQAIVSNILYQFLCVVVGMVHLPKDRRTACIGDHVLRNIHMHVNSLYNQVLYIYHGISWLPPYKDAVIRATGMPEPVARILTKRRD